MLTVVFIIIIFRIRLRTIIAPVQPHHDDGNNNNKTHTRPYYGPQMIINRIKPVAMRVRLTRLHARITVGGRPTSASSHYQPIFGVSPSGYQTNTWLHPVDPKTIAAGNEIENRWPRNIWCGTWRHSNVSNPEECRKLKNRNFIYSITLIKSVVNCVWSCITSSNRKPVKTL